MKPTPLLAAIMTLGLLVAALPTILGASLWVLVAGMWGLLALLILIDLVQLRRARPSLVVEAPNFTGVGASFQTTAELTLERLQPFRRVHVRIRPEVNELLRAEGDLAIRAEGGTHRYALRFFAPHRGGALLRALWLELRGPFGLLARIDRFHADARVDVVPNAETMREIALAHLHSAGMSGSHTQRRQGEGGEFDRLESYQTGMDLRNVDWKSSARHQSMRVRRYRVEQNQRVILCVDTGRLMRDPIAGVERIDHGIHSAILLAQLALRAGDQVGLHAYGAEPRTWLKPQSGMAQLGRIRRQCASLHAEVEETNHVLGAHTLLRRLSRRSLIVVFTEFVDPTTAELMVENLGYLARRHLVVFVALDDQAIEAPLDSPPDTRAALASASVAAQLRADRHRVLRRLSRMGVDVISAPPGRAALVLLERYVRIKRRGLIG